MEEGIGKCPRKRLGDTEQHTVRLNPVLIGRNRTKKLTHCLLYEFMKSVNSIVKNFEHDAVYLLHPRLGRVYWTACVSCPMTLTCASGVVPTSICWKGEGREDDREFEPANC